MNPIPSSSCIHKKWNPYTLELTPGCLEESIEIALYKIRVWVPLSVLLWFLSYCLNTNDINCLHTPLRSEQVLWGAAVQPCPSGALPSSFPTAQWVWPPLYPFLSPFIFLSFPAILGALRSVKFPLARSRGPRWSQSQCPGLSRSPLLEGSAGPLGQPSCWQGWAGAMPRLLCGFLSAEGRQPPELGAGTGSPHDRSPSGQQVSISLARQRRLNSRSFFPYSVFFLIALT